ncbi:MAG: bifunctional hydroxymethylpyrimidine kinase/phosphomethylpyrimidine kinase [Lentisphaerae bacterium]|nr:bifunctional hydroxymethylpyrimidine kinase/phosphomethylpyrimidine kinase [Lentisphaerota bacterium]
MDGAHNNTIRWPAALTVAGSDSGGNAGIQADLRAFHVFGVHGCTAVAALTAQNPWGVDAVLPVSPDFLGLQLDAVLPHYAIGAAKTGMLATAGLIAAVADRFARYPDILKVVDPVMVASSGARLLEAEAVAALCMRLLPLATLITPNLPEAEALLGRSIRGLAAAAGAARELRGRFGGAVLIKGGHDAAHRARDVLCDGEGTVVIESPAVDQPLSTHGTGCSLSAAITAALARGGSLRDAVIAGKAYVYEAIRTGVRVGSGAAVLGTPARIPIEGITMGALE